MARENLEKGWVRVLASAWGDAGCSQVRNLPSSWGAAAYAPGLGASGPGLRKALPGDCRAAAGAGRGIEILERSESWAACLLLGPLGSRVTPGDRCGRLPNEGLLQPVVTEVKGEKDFLASPRCG